MAKKRSMKLTEQIRKAIDESEQSRYRIAQDTGIDESALAKFYHGTRGLSQNNLERLFEYLGLQVLTEKKRK